MEQLSATLKKQIMTYHDMTKEMKYHDISHDISSFNKEMISKNDYIYLVQTLESWRVFYPKAQIKKYGARACWEAMQRVKSSNPRVPGAYFTITVRNLIDEKQNIHHSELLECDLSNTKHQEAMITGNELKRCQNEPYNLPEIKNWQEARQFVCDFYEGKIKKTNNMVEFVKKIKKQYNFA